MSRSTLDLFEFCRTTETRTSVIPVTQLLRLSAELVDNSGDLAWTLQGAQHASGHPQLTLSVAGEVKLRCQRCLHPFSHALASQTVLVLARDEADADGIEAMLNDDSIDVIVGSRTQDLVQLVEDEALLALPLSARHDTCPDGDTQRPDDKPASPFAVLKKLTP